MAFKSKKFSNNKNLFTSNKNALNKKKIFIIISSIIVLVLIILLFLQLFAAKKVSQGDTVTVNYAGYLEDGSVFDTSIEEIGIENELNKKDYTPLSFTTGTNSVIPGFEENILGMAAGDKARFTLPPDKAYGEVKENLIFKGFRRNIKVSRFSSLDLNIYNTIFEDNPVVGAVLHRQDIPWDLVIVEVNNTSVKIENKLDVGQLISVESSSWDSVVLSIDGNIILIRQNPKVGDITSLPTATGLARGIVSSVDEDTFDIDANAPLAGKSLTFEVEVLSIEKV